MLKLLSIFTGGGIGAIGRYALCSLTNRIIPGDFPVGTFLVNIIGSFLMGFLWQTIAPKIDFPHEIKAMIMVGFLGAFTTFSTYSLETVNLINDGKYAISVLNFLLNNGIAIAAVLLGFLVANRLNPIG